MKTWELGYTWDSNVCCHLQENLSPLRLFTGAVRYPVWLEDDVWQKTQEDIDQVIRDLASPGLKVLNFHPKHLTEDSEVEELFFTIAEEETKN